MSTINECSENQSQVSGYISSFLKFLQVKKDDPGTSLDEAEDDSEDDSRECDLSAERSNVVDCEDQLIESDITSEGKKKTNKLRPVEVVKPFISDDVPTAIREATVTVEHVPLNILEKSMATKKTKKNNKKKKVVSKKDFLPPIRERSRRQAKERTKPKITESLSGESEDIEPDFDFGDSDEDPAWSPIKENSDNDSHRRIGGKRKKVRTPSIEDDSSGSNSEDNGSLAKKQKKVGENKNYTDNIKTYSAASRKKTNPTGSNKGVSASPAVGKPRQSADTRFSGVNSSAEGESDIFRPGEFVVMKEDLDKEYPPIWRLDGKTLLQKYQHFEKDGEILYQNLTTFSGWTPAVRPRYLRAPIKFRVQNRKEIIVEFLQDYLELEDEDYVFDGSGKELEPLHSNLEVYLQTLISQALDPNFLTEIYRENDDYFLSNLKTIDDLAENKKSILKKMAKWQEEPIQGVETWPLFEMGMYSIANKDELCATCKKAPPSEKMELSGQAYCKSTLVKSTPSKVAEDHKELTLCVMCSEHIKVYHRVTHLKYMLFEECSKQVAEKKGDSNQDPTNILNDMLIDETWVGQVIGTVHAALKAIDKLDKKPLREFIAKKYIANKPPKK